MRSGRALGSATSASRLILGALVSGVDYVQAVRRRRELRAELQAATRGLDVVLTATQPAEAAKIDAVPGTSSTGPILRCLSTSPATGDLGVRRLW